MSATRSGSCAAIHPSTERRSAPTRAAVAAASTAARSSAGGQQPLPPASQRPDHCSQAGLVSGPGAGQGRVQGEHVQVGRGRHRRRRRGRRQPPQGQRQPGRRRARARSGGGAALEVHGHRPRHRPRASSPASWTPNRWRIAGSVRGTGPAACRIRGVGQRQQRVQRRPLDGLSQPIDRPGDAIAIPGGAHLLQLAPRLGQDAGQLDRFGDVHRHGRTAKRFLQLDDRRDLVARFGLRRRPPGHLAHQQHQTDDVSSATPPWACRTAASRRRSAAANPACRRRCSRRPGAERARPGQGRRPLRRRDRLSGRGGSSGSSWSTNHSPIPAPKASCRSGTAISAESALDPRRRGSEPGREQASRAPQRLADRRAPGHVRRGRRCPESAPPDGPGAVASAGVKRRAVRARAPAPETRPAHAPPSARRAGRRRPRWERAGNDHQLPEARRAR